MGYHDGKKFIAEFSRAHARLSYLGTVDLEHQLPSVNIDYKAAVEDSITQLAKNNEKVAFVSGPLIGVLMANTAGYKAGLEKRIICATMKGLVFEAKYNYKDGFD